MSECEINEEFKKIIIDFVSDLERTFPEYSPILNKYFKTSDDSTDFSNDKLFDVFNFCKEKYPPHFFDILYQNSTIFESQSTNDTEFLPNIHFKNLWEQNISDNTKETIWKYLQLILFTVIGKVDNSDDFGDSIKLFEAINNDNFKNKLEETFESMQNMFTQNNSDNNDDNDDKKNEPKFNIPNSENLHEHISGLLNGKLGTLATELAEEITQDMNIDENNMENMNDIFNSLIKDPKNLMGMVNKISNKLEAKFKSGDIKESELLSEASEMMSQFKNMPGMENFQQMFSQMGMDFNSKNVDTKGTQAQIQRRLKLAKTKERIRAKAELNNQRKLAEKIKHKQTSCLDDNIENTKDKIKTPLSDDDLVNIFNDNNSNSNSNSNSNGVISLKKSNKKNKNKKVKSKEDNKCIKK